MVKDISTEHKILEAAREVFLQKGMGGARMKEIAEEAGINKALLHYYFRTKEHLFDRIFRDAFRQIVGGLLDVMDSDLPLKEKIKELISVYIDTLDQNRYLPSFVLFELNQNPEKLEFLVQAELTETMPKFFMDIMQEVNAGNIRPIHPVHLFLNILGMIIFPYAARPFIGLILRNNLNVDIDQVLDERKEVIYNFVIQSIYIHPEKKTNK